MDQCFFFGLNYNDVYIWGIQSRKWMDLAGEKRRTKPIGEKSQTGVDNTVQERSRNAVVKEEAQKKRGRVTNSDGLELCPSTQMLPCILKPSSSLSNFESPYHCSTSDKTYVRDSPEDGNLAFRCFKLYDWPDALLEPCTSAKGACRNVALPFPGDRYAFHIIHHRPCYEVESTRSISRTIVDTDPDSSDQTTLSPILESGPQ